MPRRLSGFKPTGHLQLGNMLGAIRPVVQRQHSADTVAFVADLHALTVEHDPARLRDRTAQVATMLLACGLDPDACLFFVQSHVPEHSELHYLLESATGYGEAHRMIQFKEKSAGHEHVRLSLLTYPVLMAADILLYDADEVPVGDDQAQHVELARDVAVRFNARYGDTFVVPRAVNPPVAARVMDLTDPAAKMGKTNASAAGVLHLFDDPAVIRRKVARAVTDGYGEVCHDPVRQPGVTNLLDILGACTGQDPVALAGQFAGYGDLKVAVADAVAALLSPVQARYRELAADPAYVADVLRRGAEQAREVAAETVGRVRSALGLLPAYPVPPISVGGAF